MAGQLTDGGVERAARRLHVPVVALRAVVEVESNGRGFHPDGRPVILYEAHIFSRHTAGRYDTSHPRLSSRSWNRALYLGGIREWTRLYQALQLDPDAAQQACSWGLFQIMGFNWRACGERSLAGFIHAVYHHEDAHLALAANFIESQGLHIPLRRLDWAAFARGYNGPGYAANRYDTKLATAYRKHGGT